MTVAVTAAKKPCVNCTCATTGFCPRGVGANIPESMKKAEAALTPAQLARRRADARQAELRQLPQNRKRMRF